MNFQCLKYILQLLIYWLPNIITFIRHIIDRYSNMISKDDCLIRHTMDIYIYSNMSSKYILIRHTMDILIIFVLKILDHHFMWFCTLIFDSILCCKGYWDGGSQLLVVGFYKGFVFPLQGSNWKASYLNFLYVQCACIHWNS